MFEDNVYLEADPFTTLHGDKLLLHVAEEQISSIELTGNVSMISVKKEEVTIKSQKASSDYFPLYIDFMGKVSLLKDGLEIKANRIRYNRSSGEIMRE